MYIDGNSSNYVKVIDKWQPVVCADVLGEPYNGWDCRLELSTALRARQTIKPFKQFLKGVAIRLQCLCRTLLMYIVNLTRKRWISNLIPSKVSCLLIKSCTERHKLTKYAIPSTQVVHPELG